VRRKDPGWTKRLVDSIRDVKRKEIAVGYPQGRAMAYPNGRSLIEVAARHVFGEGVPQRDFMTYGRTLIEDSPLIKKIMQRIAVETGRPTANPAIISALMEAAGLEAANLIRQAILDGDWEPNSPETVARKGSSQPLIDTGHLKNSATYVVRDR
jgi:hypothetical protein